MVFSFPLQEPDADNPERACSPTAKAVYVAQRFSVILQAYTDQVELQFLLQYVPT